MNELKNYLLRNKVRAALLLLILIFQAIGTLMIPFLTAQLIDQGIINQNINQVYLIGGHMIIISVITMLFSLCGSYLSAALSVGAGTYLRDKIFRKVQTLSLSDFDKLGASTLLIRSTSDISIIQVTLMKFMQQIIPTPLIMGFAIFLTANKNPMLAVMITTLIALFALLITIILKKSTKVTLKIQGAMDNINRILRESIVGVRVIRAFNRSPFEEERNNEASSSYSLIMITLNKLFAFVNPSVWFIMGIAMAAVIWFGGFSVLQGTMALGGIIAITEYVIMVLSYMIVAATSIVTLPKMFNCLDRIQAVLTITGNHKHTANNYNINQEALSSITFDNVSFSYNQQEKVLDNVSFKSKKGEITAIIGSTGSGKSTIAKLLLGLYDLDSGNILLNDRDIREIPITDLRNMIGYVPQKNYLFKGTIQSNLEMGEPDSSSNDIKEALSISQADTFVNKLPLNIDAVVSQSGKNFSGGQKQRLAIARAIVKRPELYIFDDSFSALDYETDAALRKALVSRQEDSIMLIIAQRISTIIAAHQIIVLDEGKIVGIGTHNELLDTCKVYQEIAKSQLDMEVANE